MSECTHEWTDARSHVVTYGSTCAKCGRHDVGLLTTSRHDLILAVERFAQRLDTPDYLRTALRIAKDQEAPVPSPSPHTQRTKEA